MPDPNYGILFSGATLGLTLYDRAQRAEAEQDIQGQGPADLELSERTAESQESTQRAVEELVRQKDQQEPMPGDKDAFASAVVELAPGEVVTVTVEPDGGWNLRVKEVYFDRRTDHDYEINVGGDVSSVAHKASYVKPKLVTQSDRVIAQASNNSGSATVIDFELRAWAERPESQTGGL